MTMIPCKLEFPPEGWHLVVVCLNRVHLRGLSVDQAIAAIALTGIEPQLSYQWNPDYKKHRAKPTSEASFRGGM
ncbi:MAG: hypothetical protein F6K47_32500 [Symploca sp. SIO2E6]|nr:hypothetical protein [Symploca sp. SIO2E6]